MCYFKSELVKLKNVKLVWWMSIVSILICVFLFIQYTLNTSSGLIEPTLKNPVNNATFFLAFFSTLLANFWAIIIGSYVGASEYRDGTITLHIQSNGRYYGIIAKIAVFLLITIIQICIIFLFGFIISGVFFGFQINDFEFGRICLQLLLAVLATFTLGVMGMTIGKLFKNAMISNVMCLVIIFGFSAFPGIVGQYSCYLNPFSYLSSSFKIAYSNIDKLTNFQIVDSSLISPEFGIVCIIFINMVLIIIQLLSNRYEQY